VLSSREAFELAVANIARWGDTDVFPFAPENHVFFDRSQDVLGLLVGVEADLDAALIRTPIQIEGVLSLVTYEGFRWVAQIDPLWNAYFLGLVLRIGPEIEAARLEQSRNIIFSYRLSIDKDRSTIFDDGGWRSFSERSIVLARDYDYVVVADIADHYGRIYHHRLKNAVQLTGVAGDEPSRIERLLRDFSGGPSYGLPVGGPAARILAELSLNRTDRLLVTRQIPFCRYADDYRLFATTRNEAFRTLVYLSEVLLRHEGLTLQRQKTRVIASKDFLRSPLFALDDDGEGEDGGGSTEEEREERRFLRLSLRYDPYSPTAEEDYQRLKRSLEEFDIMAMLTREVNKSRINVAVVRRLAQAIRHLDSEVRDVAVETLATNLDVLAPALPVVLRVIEELMPDLNEETRSLVTNSIRHSIREHDYFLNVPVNLAYALRVLRTDRSEENVTMATNLFDGVPMFIKRDIVYLMDYWDADYWLSDLRRQWANQHPWVKRALLLTSYSLGDEGRHWRGDVDDQLPAFDVVCRDWMRDRINNNQRKVPL
jgi:Reverse transcriptase (RNA-dependent DNA polymerase)